MNLFEKIVFCFLYVIAVLTVVFMCYMGITQNTKADEMCHPYKAKHHFLDADSGEMRVICYTKDGKDELK